MKDINLKNKKKIDNNCQCLCHFDTKQLLSSVKYCDRCIEIHKTEPISPFKPNGWEEKIENILLAVVRPYTDDFKVLNKERGNKWEKGETMSVTQAVKELSQAILSAEEAKVRECVEDLMEVKRRIKIPKDIFSPKDYPYECGFLSGTNECLSKLVRRLPDETKTTTENPLSLPDQEQLKIKK